jgi:hypothetical protein
MIIPINDFRISIKNYQDSNDIIILEFYLNNSNFMNFPFYKKNILEEIILKFKKVIDGKQSVINLNFQNDMNTSNILQFEKDYILFNIVRTINNFTSEIYLKCENNSIVRNELRNFIDNYENIFRKFESQYWEYNGVFIPNLIDRVPSKDQVNTVFKNGKSSKFISTKNMLTIDEYRKLFAYKNKEGQFIYKVPGANIKEKHFFNYNEWSESTWYQNRKKSLLIEAFNKMKNF